MMEGWVKLYRKIKESSFYHDSNLVHLWLHIMLSANKFEQNYLWHGEEIVIQPGQFITGRKKLSAETGIQESKIQRALKMFEKMKMIEQQTNSKSRMITVINWNMHQDNEQQTNNKRTTTEQQLNTNKKEKKEKKVKNKRNPLEEKASFISGIPESIYKTYPDFSKNEIESIVDNLVDYCLANGKTYKDYYAALRNFLKSERKNKNGSCSINEKKIDFDRYKKLFSHAKSKTKNGDKPKFKEDGLNQILLKYPHILEYETDSVSFEITYKEYLKL